MDVLAILAKDHDKWVGFVENLGANEAISEDIVQDTYLRVARMKNPLKMLYNKSEVNYWYFCLTLRSVFIDYTRVVERKSKAELRFLENTDPDMDKEEAWERLYQNIIAYINDFGKYGSVLSQMYFKTDYSLRDLSEMSEITLTSIYNSIRKYRDELKAEFGEDWEDYLNEDYDKI